MARTYDPYGVVTAATGSSASGYGFTGEYQSADLVYLRARHYAPGMGRFLTRDTWPGQANRPLSFNRWGYVEGNPINSTDPTGHISEGFQAQKANLIVEKLKQYNVYIEKDWGYRLLPVPADALPSGVLTGILYYGCEWEKGNWRNAHELELIFEGVKEMAKKLGGANKFKSALWGMKIDFKRMSEGTHPSGAVAWTVLDVKFYNDAFNYGDLFASGTVVHELAHVWDTRQSWTFLLSTNMYYLTGSFTMVCSKIWYKFDPSCYKFNKTGELPPTTYGQSGPREDFADSFAI